MKKIKFKNIYAGILGLIAVSVTSCTGDLDTDPRVEQTKDNILAEDPEAYKGMLAKIYSAFILTGQETSGQTDVVAPDAGASSYIRNYWNFQELTTDEALNRWGDGGLDALNRLNWTAGNNFVRILYDRIYLEIAMANNFLRETDGIEDAEIQDYRNEARFLRALAYWHAIDMFGNVPFVTENDPVGNFEPPRYTREELFDYLESELLEIIPLMKEPRSNEYARADRVAGWMLLAKLYLNAEVYTGEVKYSEALTYLDKIVQEGGYTLEPVYQNLFLADNDNSTEIILPLASDGLRSQSYGGTTYIIHAGISNSTMDPSEYGVNGGWEGNRTTSSFADLFGNLDTNPDQRALFHTEGHIKENTDYTAFNNGYAIAKYKNLTSTGEIGSDTSGEFVDTDYPLFRLADAYLMYAEAALRTGSDMTTALDLVNQLRERAYGNTSGNITSAQLTLDFILDERGRELYWEGHRRTDLIRFGKFTGSEYLWPWKGGSLNGSGVESFRTLLPIPLTDLGVNSNLVQNPGY
ncbi:RagB/SusD family nutrient uptake outer membrane protein [Sinomicrobium pectinilyticum]|uniref:RagB/SusD family nutrient uptake outer membrane protein n=1 Tax=Sinomicrobium pectinilyticum TaxID=1084421 RepID=A0A3N0E7C5_SINP1|nr:RagB/SusD family nutrient uptake outer membrane protein [Sinomicrobium pectinilyticum]RNL83752.1 RagB/SusD family nutrient uptake outer membrane protein [Sinomicrobium pectinilyticum]